jgi:hypothetical protein
LTGVWNGTVSVPPFDPANAQPWVIDLARQRQHDYYRARPSYQCLPSGPEADRFAGWKRLLQTPTALAILNDDLTYRLIFMDGRELETNPAPSWMGYSEGRWDGDTLIVDSAGFNDKTWLSQRGLPHSEALRVMERYRRLDVGHLQVEVTFTDPATYETRPLVPLSQTLFEGQGLFYQFIVDDTGMVTDVVEIRTSGSYRYPRLS